MTLEPSQATLTVSPSEFYDRLAILEVKLVRISNHARRRSAARLHEVLLDGNAALVRHRHTADQVKQWYERLKVVHQQLWDTENLIRGMDETIFDGESFRGGQSAANAAAYMLAARRVYILNDRRTEIKKEIDALFGQEPEVKEYEHYGRPSDHAAEAGEEEAQESGSACRKSSNPK